MNYKKFSGICLALFLLFVCGCLKKNCADMILYHGTVLTVDKNMSQAQAVAVRDGKILEVGTEKQVLKYKSRATKMVDLKGATLMPGFVETHSHPVLKMVVENFAVDIRPAFITDGVKVTQIIKESIANAKPGEYLVFFGWDPLLQAGLKNPTIQELDALAPNNPIFIWGNSVHVAFANSKAFELAGINKNTPDPKGASAGTFGHDKNGELNGRIDQGAPILMAISPYLKTKISDPQKAMEYIAKAWKISASDGITTVTDSVLDEEFYKLYQGTAKKLDSVRVRGYALDYDKWQPFEGDAMVKVNGGKLFIDGSPWTGTITMTEPYLVNETTVNVMDTPAGYIQTPYVSAEDLQVFIDNCLKSRRSAQIHAEGDQAIQMALDAIEKGLQKYPWYDHRICLEHVPMIRDDQLARAAKLNVPVTFLMAHVKYWGDVIPTLVGDERGQRWCPVASAKKAGVNYAFHFDGPTSPNKPIEVLETVVTRKTVGGKVLGPQERVSIDDAIRGYTINAAYQLFMNNEVGSIEPGKYADMIILSANPREVPAEEISEIKVLVTYIGGKEIFVKGR